MDFCIRGRLVTPDSIACVVEVDGGVISGLSRDVRPGGRVYDFEGCYVLPGFIDIHMHGHGAGGLFTADEICSVAESLGRFGTTGFLPTAASLPKERYFEFADNVREAQRRRPAGAKILGAHFEGPFINPQRKGGMDAALLREPDATECGQYLEKAGDVLRIMTLSPELPQSGPIIRMLAEHGVTVSAGHTDMTPEQLTIAAAAGVRHVCHLFNTFRKTGEVSLGPVRVSALIDAIVHRGDLTCEVICDMKHVPPESIRAAAEALGEDRFVAITDSAQGAGLPEGVYRMVDGREYSTEGSIARLTGNGTVIGSVLTMERAFANLVRVCGLSIHTAAKYTSTNPARAIRMSDRIGQIAVGHRADLTVLDSDFRCAAAFADGRLVYRR